MCGDNAMLLLLLLLLAGLSHMQLLLYYIMNMYLYTQGLSGFCIKEEIRTARGREGERLRADGYRQGEHY